MCLLCRTVVLLTSVYISLQTNTGHAYGHFVQVLASSLLLFHACLPAVGYAIAYLTRFAIATVLYGYASFQVELHSFHRKTSWNIVHSLLVCVCIVKTFLKTGIICCYQLWSQNRRCLQISPTSLLKVSIQGIVILFKESGMLTLLQFFQQKQVSTVMQVCGPSLNSYIMQQ